VTVDVAGTVDGAITGSHGITVTPDTTVPAVDPDAYDCVALPGGMPGTVNLRENADVLRIVRTLAARERWTTAICAAPTVLHDAGVTAGRTVTSHPSVTSVLTDARYSEEPVVIDGRVITSRGAGTAMRFALALVEHLVDRDTADRLRAQMVVPFR
jgi:4-methyl-5(b-hydroxyethyl)-thiazole monophosphate biosynthesis